jgi:hypothetical protein
LFADLFSSPFVFVVWCHVADPGVESHRVVFDPDSFQSGFEDEVVILLTGWLTLKLEGYEK